MMLYNQLTRIDHSRDSIDLDAPMIHRCTVILCLSLSLVSISEADELFKRWDKNSDGKLSRDELPEGPRKNFDRADTNQNGTISLQEHMEFLSRGSRRNVPQLPENVETKRDIVYVSNGHPRQALDLYLPKHRKHSKLPVIVFIHGGAWKQGDKSGGQHWVVPHVQTGEFVGVSVNYRLSQHAQWPAQIHDVKAAIRWLRGQADEFGIDPNRIGVIGTSAGGHLVSMLGVSGDVPELEGTLGEHTNQKSSVTCVVNYFGPAHLLSMGNFPSVIAHNEANSPESKLIGGPIQENKVVANQASPRIHVSAKDAPFLHIHGTKDKLVPYDQSVQLDKSLDKVNVPSTLITVDNGGHGGFKNPEITKLVTEYWHHHLLGKKFEFTEMTLEP